MTAPSPHPLVTTHLAAPPSPPGTFLIGYHVEARNPDTTRPFLRRALQIHEATGVPATFFLCGRTIELNKEDLRPFANHPLFALPQHTYNPVLLKTACIEDPAEGITCFKG